MGSIDRLSPAKSCSCIQRLTPMTNVHAAGDREGELFDAALLAHESASGTRIRRSAVAPRLGLESICGGPEEFKWSCDIAPSRIVYTWPLTR